MTPAPPIRPRRSGSGRIRGFRRGVGIVCVLVFSTLGVSATVAQSRPFASRVGVNVKFAQGEPMADLAKLTDLGLRWVRDSVAWPDVEPVAGRYAAFSKDFDDRLAFYKAHDIGVCFGLWYDNPKAYPNTPDDPHHAWDAAAYGRYGAEVATRLRAAGVRFVIELYNEPHNSLKDFGGAWNGVPPCPWLDQYVAMVTAATAAIKAADPQARVLVCDDMWVLHYRFLEKGLPAAVDGLAVHPYVKAWPESAATEPDTSWTQPFVTVDADRSVRSAVRRLRDHAADKLGHTPAVWFTEWGWPLGEAVHDRAMTEDLLAGLIVRAYLTAADAGAETLLWFSLTDSVDGPMGLTDHDGKPRRPYAALKTMVQRIGRTTTLAHVVGSDHPTAGLQAYRLGGAGADVWVVWDIDGDAPVTLRGQSGAVHAEDVLGRLVTLQPNAFVVGRSPLYLTGLAPGAALALVPQTGRPAVDLFP